MTDLTIADVLDRAADLIEPEGRWTQGTLYKDVTGAPAGASSGPPCCWCAVGAILHQQPLGSLSKVLSAAEAGLPETPVGSLRPLSAWNDAPERTQAEVVAKLREAANLARTGAAS